MLQVYIGLSRRRSTRKRKRKSKKKKTVSRANSKTKDISEHTFGFPLSPSFTVEAPSFPRRGVFTALIVPLTNAKLLPPPSSLSLPPTTQFMSSIRSLSLSLSLTRSAPLPLLLSSLPSLPRLRPSVFVDSFQFVFEMEDEDEEHQMETREEARARTRQCRPT